jgi:hypothetical protein
MQRVGFSHRPPERLAGRARLLPSHRLRGRLGDSPAARLRDRRWPRPVAHSDPLHDAGYLHLLRQAADVDIPEKNASACRSPAATGRMINNAYDVCKDTMRAFGELLIKYLRLHAGEALYW